MQDTKIHTTTKYTESLDTSANTIAEESTSQNELISQAHNHNPNSETLTEQTQKNNLTHETQSNKTQQDSYLQKLQHFYENITKHRYFISEKISYCWHAITDNDRIFHYAASLSFYSIFSIIPAFLMFFSLFSLFPSFQDQIQILKQSILDNILPDNAHEFAQILDNFLSNGKEMGFVGFLISLISSFIFFRNFDDVAARIFEAKKRGYFDSFIIYWLLITLIPMFLATSIYFNAVIVDIYSDAVITKYYSFIPMLATWIAFAMLFRVAANKPLRFLVLILASLLGAIVWYGLKIIFFYYMSYNKFYSNIYGSVSIIMFAFLWIYVSWLVVLFSMQFCKWLDTKYPCSES